MTSPIHEVFSEIRDRAKANGMPFEFTFGQPQVPQKVGTTRLYMSTVPQADQMRGARANQRNPKRQNVRAVGVAVRIFASSHLAGAQRHNHESLALQVAAIVDSALHYVVRKSKTLYESGAVGFVDDATTDGWAGVVYEARYAIDVPVAAVKWTGEAAAEFEFETGTTSMDVDGPGVPTGLPNASTRVS